MLIKEAIDEFIVSCEAKDLSVRTCQWYRWHLEGFATWLGDRPLSVATLREYMASLRRKEWANSSLRGAARTLKIWCRWLYEEGAIRTPITGNGWQCQRKNNTRRR